MDTSLIYAIVMGGSFLLVLLINGLPLIACLVRYLSPLISKHLIYRYILHRHRLLALILVSTSSLLLNKLGVSYRVNYKYDYNILKEVFRREFTIDIIVLEYYKYRRGLIKESILSLLISLKISKLILAKAL
jgi:hypothetical protein